MYICLKMLTIMQLEIWFFDLRHNGSNSKFIKTLKTILFKYTGRSQWQIRV